MSDAVETLNKAGKEAVAAAPGDDGFIAQEALSIPKALSTSNFAAANKTNADIIRQYISAKLDQTAKNVDWSRDNFAKTAVVDCINAWPEFNWIMCHVAHSYIWMGERGVDWEHWHYELDVYGPGTIGYEVYWVRQGVFTRQGDGGFINWAYIGNVKKVDSSGQTLMFSLR